MMGIEQYYNMQDEVLRVLKEGRESFNKPYLTIAEVANVLGVNFHTAKRHIEDLRFRRQIWKVGKGYTDVSPEAAAHFKIHGYYPGGNEVIDA